MLTIATINTLPPRPYAQMCKNETLVFSVSRFLPFKFAPCPASKNSQPWE